MKRGVNIRITLQRKHFYTLVAILTLALAAVLVNAFGSNNPAVLGHSAGELIVNSTSIVDGSIVDADVNAAAAIAGSKISAASLSGSAPGLSVGSATNAGTASTAINCGDNSNACHLGAGTGNNGDSSCSSNPPRWGSDSCYANLYSQNGLCVPGGSCLSTSTVITNSGEVRVHSGNGGGNRVFRCTAGGGVEPNGALTTVSGNCAAFVATSLFVD